ncbi:MAG: methyltransferase domain-containing protein, partial [Brevundimonas sp.]|uniref:methyltransferase domain-containing protein n=1 Tax=Brevundimonas sp. TaxID=1871086 RepID=UPI002AB8714F
MSDWSPSSYLTFEDERTRAARDLLAAVPLAEARAVVDVGCGPGNSTELLARRYPEAAVTGFDTSPAMLEAARSRVPSARFVAGDAATWEPDGPVDLFFANAVL